MNRRQGIIISITGIFIVLLLLVGLTYAYFLTEITTNENDKSVSVTVANLKLSYGDGNGIITTNETIVPGTTLDSKTFTVRNDGSLKTDYVVVIEDVKVTYATTVGENVAGTTATFESNDFVYTLTCESDGAACNGVNIETVFPMNGAVIAGNNIEVGKIHTYTLTVTYKETGVNQSADMNKMLEAKVNIADITSINPYSDNTNSLAYNIINNAIGLTTEEKNDGYAELVATPPTKVASALSATNESVLSVTQDDLGTSYYYRGSVKNNYVTFNNMCWRIVRIEGDGAVKLILADKDAECSTATLEKPISSSIGSNYYNKNGKPDYDTGAMKEMLESWFNGLQDDGVTPRFNETIKSKLKLSSICLGDLSTKYDENWNVLTDSQLDGLSNWNYNTYKRLLKDKSATLVCDLTGTRTNETQVYSLTADEIIFAGGKSKTGNNDYYLFANSEFSWWTISPSFYKSYAFAFYMAKGSLATYGAKLVSFNLRPVISLISNIEIISGDGSISDPYIIV